MDGLRKWFSKQVYLTFQKAFFKACLKAFLLLLNGLINHFASVQNLPMSQAVGTDRSIHFEPHQVYEILNHLTRHKASVDFPFNIYGEVAIFHNPFCHLFVQQIDERRVPLSSKYEILRPIKILYTSFKLTFEELRD